jgi:hypothetical protein
LPLPPSGTAAPAMAFSLGQSSILRSAFFPLRLPSDFLK